MSHTPTVWDSTRRDTSMINNATERCSSAHCQRPLTGRGVITDRDGRRYCRKHGDKLPPYLRRPRRTARQPTGADA
jgi:hypothetical protein